MNDLFKNVRNAALGLAVVTTERVQEWVEELVERGREYQENRQNPPSEKEQENHEKAEGEIEAEAIKDFSQEFKMRRDEVEQRIRDLIDSAIQKFNFIKNDDHDRITKRIQKLEERLSNLAKEASKSSKSTDRI